MLATQLIFASWGVKSSRGGGKGVSTFPIGNILSLVVFSRGARSFWVYVWGTGGPGEAGGGGGAGSCLYLGGWGGEGWGGRWERYLFLLLSYMVGDF